jgi:hypothetical protein
MLIKKSKSLTEISKALFGPEVKATYATGYWYHDEKKAGAVDGLNRVVKRLEEANKGFQRHKDNTGADLTWGDERIIIEYKDGRLLQLHGGDWANAQLISRDGLEEVI